MASTSRGRLAWGLPLDFSSRGMSPGGPSPAPRIAKIALLARSWRRSGSVPNGPMSGGKGAHGPIDAMSAGHAGGSCAPSEVRPLQSRNVPRSVGPPTAAGTCTAVRPTRRDFLRRQTYVICTGPLGHSASSDMPLLSMKPMFRIGPWSMIGVVSTPWRVKRSRSASPAASSGSASEMCERKVAPGSKTAACSVRRTEQRGLRILKEMQAGSVGFAIGSRRVARGVPRRGR